jgi:4-hydroxy-2-oxoheptanedioate aldolase
MRENRIRTLWAEGKPVINGWLHIPSMWSTELMANQAWDSLLVDMQHGMMSMETTIQMLQAISTTDTVPLVRVNWNTPGDIMRVLDGGAYGVICPMVDTREQCEAFIGACRYPPMGYRSLGPTRAKVYAGDDYAEHANDTIVTMAMIETQESFDNREEIMSVEGLDAVFVGLGDLRLSMTGQAGFDSSDTVIDDALNAILESANKHNVKAGLFTTDPLYAAEMVNRGYQFVTVMTDSVLLSSAAASTIETVRQNIRKL